MAEKQYASPRKRLPLSASQFADNYDQYLIKLAEKNKSLKELRRKDKEVIALESREQGFSVYINGANSKSLSLSKQDVCHQQRKAKTADPKQQRRDSPDSSNVRKSNSHRKGWDQRAVSVRTEHGDAVHIAVPSILTGEYSKDFEEDNDISSDNDEDNQGTNLELKNSQEIEENSLSPENDSLDSFHSSNSFMDTLLAPPISTESMGVVLEDSLTENHQQVESIKDSLSDQSSLDSFLNQSSPSHDSNKLDDDNIMGVVSPTHSSDTTLNIVTETVKRMDPKMQQQLLNIIKDMSVNNTLPVLSQRTDGMSSLTSDLIYSPSKSTVSPVPNVSPPVSSYVSISTVPPVSISPVPNVSPPVSIPPVSSYVSISTVPPVSISPVPNVSPPVSIPPVPPVPPVPISSVSPPVSSFVSISPVQISSVPITSLSSLPSWLQSKDSSVRISGLRGLYQQELRSSSDSNLFSDNIPPRLKTATIAKGRRQFQYGSETYLVPSAEDTIDLTNERTKSLTFTPFIEPSLITPSHIEPSLITQSHIESSLITPSHIEPSLITQSHIEPSLITQSHIEPSLITQSHIEPSLDTEQETDLRSSIQKFDQRRHWASDDQDDLLASFLADYQQRHTETIDSVDIAVTQDFEIPELPKGKELIMNIFSTWGDRYYVGLTGIEVFTSSGIEPIISQISAIPADINVLPEYNNDPRIVSNLIDGVNETRDDLHMWLAPFFPYKDHHIKIIFQQSISIAMIRIWNYNKSRIHSFRGVKDVQLILDDVIIFEGEIAKASGGVADGSVENFAETILFTVDEDILVNIAQHDSIYLSHVINQTNNEVQEYRPSTSDNIQLLEELEDRPFTSTVIPLIAIREKGWSQVTGKSILLTLLSTWGSSSIGLTGIELFDSNNSVIPLSSSQITLVDRESDSSIEKLVDRQNVVTDICHMWSVPFCVDQPVKFQINLNSSHQLNGMKIWNYNEDSYTGVKLMTVHVDDKLISPPNGFLLRRGPGNDHYDYGQFLQFMIYSPNHIYNDISTSSLPCGFVYQIQLLSSWGDPYYIGLTGLQIKNEHDKIVSLTANNIAAYPDSVNVLDGIDNDVRTSDKLIDGIVDSQESKHMWLSPILPAVYNTVYIIFDHLQTLSSITLWNYGKTPSRGVKEFSVLVDDLLVYTGVLPKAPLPSSGILPTVAPPIAPFVVKFTEPMTRDDFYDVQHQKDGLIITDRSTNGTNTNTNGSSKSLRPFTSVTINKSRHNKRH